MIPVYLNTKSRPYSLPENWNEIPAEKLFHIAPLLLKKEHTVQERGYIAMQLIGLKNEAYSVKLSRKPGGYDYLAGELIDKINPLIGWLFEKNQLTRQPLPELDINERFRFFGTRKLYGPADAFNNITLAEFSDTEECLKQYAATNDETWLNRFIAILYRPRKTKPELKAKDYNGDVRQRYNFHLNDFIAVMVSKLDARHKAMVLLWYQGCYSELTEQYAFMFTGDKKKQQASGSFTDVIHALAGPKFGTLEETGCLLLRTALYELKLMHEQHG